MTPFDEYTGEKPLDERAAATGKPLTGDHGRRGADRRAIRREALAAYREKSGCADQADRRAQATHQTLRSRPRQRPSCSVSSPRSRRRKPPPGTKSQESSAESGRRPRAPLDYEPMFDSKQTLTERITDAVDLMIDFATLGEYGLEPADGAAPSCESRHRPHPARAADDAAPTAPSPAATGARPGGHDAPSQVAGRWPGCLARRPRGGAAISWHFSSLVLCSRPLSLVRSVEIEAVSADRIELKASEATSAPRLLRTRLGGRPCRGRADPR